MTATVAAGVAAWAVPLAVSLRGADRTVWDGVYSTEQATRGRTTYQVYCASCHQDDLSGGGSFGMEEAPALVRDDFMLGRDLNNVFVFIRANMPADNVGTLSPDAYLDVLAFVLQQNGFPAGMQPLPAQADALKAIRIVAKPQ